MLMKSNQGLPYPEASRWSAAVAVWECLPCVAAVAAVAVMEGWVPVLFGGAGPTFSDVIVAHLPMMRVRTDSRVTLVYDRA